MSQNGPFGPVSPKTPSSTNVKANPVKHTDGRENLRVGKPTIHRAGK